MIPISVAIITYNHDAYIDEALSSVLIQNTSLNYEIIIGDDASTDETVKKLKLWADQYPNIIRLILRDSNAGMMDNFLSVIEACQGKYIAFLEGDDYWTDDDKLNAQFRILEMHPEYSMVFGEVEVLEHATSTILGTKSGWQEEKRFELSDFVVKNPANLMTAFFRNPKWISRPPVLSSVPFGDWPLFTYLSESGGVVYQPTIWARYRIHETGVWQNGRAEQIETREVQMLQKFYFTYNKYRPNIGRAIGRKQWEICERQLKVGDFKSAFLGLVQSYHVLTIVDKVNWLPLILKFYWVTITDKRFYLVLLNKMKFL